ncbi:MAG: sigma 54-interacting transcriptional regulator [Planctomycetota bacterium]
MPSQDSEVRESAVGERSDEPVRLREARLAAAQRIAHVGNWDWDIQSNVLLWSDEVYRIFGLDSGEFESTYEAFLNAVHCEDRELVKRSVDDALNRRIPYRIDHRVVRPDGSERIVHERAEVTFSETGKPVRMLGTIQDITERKRAELALEASEATLTAIFQSAPVAMLLVDRDRRVERMNRVAEEVMGSGTEESACVAFGNILRCVHALQDIQGCGCSSFCSRCLVRSIVHDTFDVGRDYRNVDFTTTVERDGSPVARYLRVSAAPVELCQGRKVLVCLEDITGRKQAELDLQQAFTEIETLKNKLQRENICLREEIQLRYEHEEIVGSSAAIKAVMGQVEQVADTPASVLLEGETGTGKELFARAIHKLSPRRDATMVTVNCAALPATLMESELFGREAGAYTGALSKQIGRFEMADGSTLFLDEVGELSMELQAKLLRILQENTFERLGSSETISVDVRIIAATNHNLRQGIQDGKFREDLFHRLNVFPIVIPPLRERTEDIPTLVWAFVKELGARMGKAVDTIPRKAMQDMQSYPWPGNVRELRNVIERSMILTKGSTLQVDVPSISGSSTAKPMTLAEVEKQHILEVLNKTGWRIRGKNGAAGILGLKPTTLESRMAKRGIERGRSNFTTD